MDDKDRTETKVTKESERKPSLQHSVSKEDEKMKVKDSISDRTTLAIAELKQDVIKADDSQIKSVKAEESSNIASTTDNEGQGDGTENDQQTRTEKDKSTAIEDTHQDSVRELHLKNDNQITDTQEKDEHVTSTEKKDQLKMPKGEDSQKQREKLNQTNNNETLKLDTKTKETDQKEGKLTEDTIFKAKETHEIAPIALVNHNDKDDIDEQPKVSETNLKQNTDAHAPEEDNKISTNEETSIVPDETKTVSEIDLKLDTNTTRKEKQTVEGDSLIISEQKGTISTKEDSKMESPIIKKIEINQNDKNQKECSSQGKKVKMVKKKKKKAPIVEESSEIHFDELLSPKEVDTGKESLAKTSENSYIVEEPDSEEKMQLNVHPDIESVEISEDKSEESSTQSRPASEKTPENLSPIPAKGSKTSDSPKIDVTVEQIPKIDEPVPSNFYSEEVKPKSAKVNKEFNEVYTCSVGMILMKLTKHVEADIKMVLL